MNITLYGASDETYERLCRNPRGYTQTVNAVKMLKKAGISVKFNASMTPWNIGDLDGIYRIAQELDVYVQAAAYMYPPVRKDLERIGQGNRFTAEEAGKWEAAIDRKRLTPEQYQARVEQIRRNILEKSSADQGMQSETGEPMRCRAGRTSFWINWKGEMTPCGMMVMPVTYPFRDGLMKAWDELRDETAKILLPAKCRGCTMKDLCPVCAASVYTETGNFDTAPEYLCRMTRTKVRCTAGESE